MLLNSGVVGHYIYIYVYIHTHIHTYILTLTAVPLIEGPILRVYLQKLMVTLGRYKK